MLGIGLLCLFFYLLCYAAVLKILTYYAQYYADIIGWSLINALEIEVSATHQPQGGADVSRGGID